MLINDYTSAAAGGSPRLVPLFWWQGWSSAWYVTSVFLLRDFRCLEAGTFILVRRDSNGMATPLLVGAGASVSDDLFNHHGDALMRAIKAGATEVHVHLAADTPEQRELAMDDIAQGWCMPTQRPVLVD